MQHSDPLRSYVRQILLERVLGAQAFVYHGSKSEPDKLISALIEDKFQAGYGEMYGKGLYTVYDLKGTQTDTGSYGQYIYKLKINLYGFVIFDIDVAKRVYGKKLSPKAQLELLGEDDLAQKMSGLNLTTGQFTSDGALLASEFLKGKVKGIVFTGREDGRVAVIYDSAIVVPVAWKKAGAQIWNKIDKEKLKPALRRSALGEFEKDRFEDKEWRNEQGQLHREDGPALIKTNGDQFWWLNGKLHRTDGPAAIWADGARAWWLNGKHLSQEKHAQRTSDH